MPESREELLSRYQCAIPRASSVSRSLARQSKSRMRAMRAGSAHPAFGRASVERYVPNSAADEYEELVNLNRRARSVAYSAKANAVSAAEAALNERKKQRQLRARSGKLHEFIFF